MSILPSSFIRLARLFERIGHSRYAAAGVEALGRRGRVLWIATLLVAAVLGYASFVGADCDVALFSFFAVLIQHATLRVRLLSRALGRAVDRFAALFTVRFFFGLVLRLSPLDFCFVSVLSTPAAPPPRACSRR